MLNLPGNEPRRLGIAKLALKIDVDTYRGTREGVPRLLELLKQQRILLTVHFFEFSPILQHQTVLF